MKKVLGFIGMLIMALIMFMFAGCSIPGSIGQFGQVIADLSNTVTGVAVLFGIVIAVALFVVKKTSTKSDDAMVEKIGRYIIPVAHSIETIIPNNVQITSLAYVDRCLEELVKTYEAEHGKSLDENVIDFAKRQFQKMAEVSPKAKN
jgi:hypothetical protein